MITFRRQPNALQVASERTTMEEAVPNPNILVSKFRVSLRFITHTYMYFSWLPLAKAIQRNVNKIFDAAKGGGLLALVVR